MRAERTNMTFGNYTYMPYILLATGLTLAAFIFYIFWKRRIVKVLFKNGTDYLVRGSLKIARAKEIIILIAILLFGFILLRPQWGIKTREVQNEGTDVLIALDVSRSMLARDIKPSRLERAKSAVRWIANSLRGDRIGLVLFAGDAFLQCPLTSDIGAFMMFLNAANPKAIGLQGTDIGKALNSAARVFKKKQLTTKMFVLITDGEDHQGSAQKAVDTFKDLGVSVYTIGIGKQAGDYIPVDKNDQSANSYYRDRKGKLIKTSQNRKLLRLISKSTGGAYIDITSSISGLDKITDKIKDQQKNKFGSRVIKEKKDQFAIFALVLIALLSVEMLLAERRE